MPSLLSHYHKTVLNRGLTKLISTEFALASIAAGTFAWLGYRGNYEGQLLAVEACAKTISSYSSLGLAACLAVMSIVARWVGPEFIQRVVDNGLNFEDAIWRLSLITLSNWITLLIASLVPLLVPANFNLLGSSAVARSLGSVLVFLMTYTVLNYFLVIALVSILAIQKVEHKCQTPTK